MVAVEIDKRVKATGDSEYGLGTSRSAVSFTGKKYMPSGRVRAGASRAGAAAATAFGDSDGPTAIDVELAEGANRGTPRCRRGALRGGDETMPCNSPREEATAAAAASAHCEPRRRPR